MMSELVTIGTYSVFIASYVVFALGKFPGMKIDRPGAAIIGAVLMFAIGAMHAHDALQFIHFGTVALLFSMMLVVALPAFGWLLRLDHGAGRDSTQAPPPAPHSDFPERIAFRVLRQRHHLHCHGSFRLESHPPNGGQTNTLSLSSGNGVKHREYRNHHGEPAEHSDRVFFRHWVSGFPMALRSRRARRLVSELARTLVALFP